MSDRYTMTSAEYAAFEAEREGWRLESFEMAGKYHAEVEARARDTKDLQSWIGFAQKYQDDALAAQVEADEANAQLQYSLDREAELKQKVAALETLLAEARNARDNLVTMRPGLS